MQWEPTVPWPQRSATLLAGLLALLIVLATIFVLVFARALAISQRGPVPKCRRRHTPTHLLVVLGSGGHTTEMFSMLRCMPLDPAIYTYRTYVVSSGDSFSARKALEFEEELEGTGHHDHADGEKHDDDASSLQSDSYIIITVPRARRVHQSFLTAPFSTLQCFWACLQVLRGAHPDQRSFKRKAASTYPDLILTNGPATAVCVILAAKLLRLLNYTFPRRSRSLQSPSGQCVGSESKELSPAPLRTIFVESWARVTTLSLSGKILLPFVDRFLVQWPALAGRRAWKGMRETQYVGTLVY
ncbi:hypothetical protein DTO166G4_2633 [Paecilomyces variotii]|nr:hypothetical protein DTO166G4_2633 [Paecilomyces variotii]KAJ9240417.1 hypothetical protein DTO166G5_1755 [Paecilomyces variotii]KAJ9306100.1 hypothetical protein DTO217A2_4400 [Paecilomyces variotii]KAJ9372006.1 hypothetical protein DTO282E5_3360 [Paecilomyces variotii]